MNNDLDSVLREDKSIIKLAKLSAKTFEHQLILNELNKGTMPLYITNIDLTNDNSIVLSQTIRKKSTDLNRNVEITWDFEIGRSKINILQ